MKKKAILFSLFFTCLCLAGGCGLTADTGSTEGTTPSGNMAENETYGTETSVLDQGGANGTDNVSIMDYLEDTETDPSNITDHTGASEIHDPDNAAGNLMDDLGDAVQDIGETVEDGIDALTSPNPFGTTPSNTTTSGSQTGTTTPSGNNSGSATSSTNTGVVPGGNGR